jgi:hypothetical protein
MHQRSRHVTRLGLTRWNYSGVHNYDLGPLRLARIFKVVVLTNNLNLTYSMKKHVYSSRPVMLLANNADQSKQIFSTDR